MENSIQNKYGHAAKYFLQIIAKRKKLEELKKQESEVYEDIKNAQDLFTLFLREKYEAEGFKKDAEVIFKSKKTKHTITTLFFDDEKLDMAVILNPHVNKGIFKNVYLGELELVKTKKKK